MTQKLTNKVIDKIYEMTNLWPKRTGLPMVVWIQPRTGKEKHGPRIKVQTVHGQKVHADKMVSVGFDRNGNVTNFGGLTKDDFELAKKFIELNHKGLVQLWDNEIDPLEFMNNIQKVNS